MGKVQSEKRNLIYMLGLNSNYCQVSLSLTHDVRDVMYAENYAENLLSISLFLSIYLSISISTLSLSYLVKTTDPIAVIQTVLESTHQGKGPFF
jgi:hypothetical protein